MKKIVFTLINLCALAYMLHAQVLYGTAGGGKYGGGTINRFEMATSTFNVVKDFVYPGYRPEEGLVLASDGKFYGITIQGGTYGSGTIFSYDPATDSSAQLFSFNQSSGYFSVFPTGNLIQASDGKLYGTTNYGAANNNGSIFSFDPATAAFTKLLDLGGTYGTNIAGNLVEASNGKLYGTTKNGGANDFGTIFSFEPATVTYTKLFDFNNNNGAYPQGSLTKASDGKMYGTTRLGGANGLGVIFFFNPASAGFKKLYDFSSATGANPQGNLTEASNGKLYGTTNAGGIGGTNGSGVIFSFDPSKSVYTKVHDFDSLYHIYLLGSLVEAPDEKLYGTTVGFIFSIDPATNKYVKLFDYDSEHKPANDGGFILAPDGKLFALSETGGTASGGALFSYTIATNTYSIVEDVGINPEGFGLSNCNLFKAPDGLLYGMTSAGGNYNKGVIFSYNPATNIYKKLKDFDGINGGSPFQNNLIQASDGKLYGVTQGGGLNGIGALFSFDPATATYTKLVDFVGVQKGAYPDGGLIQASDGKLYGVTQGGGYGGYEFGDPGWGVVFSYDLVTYTFKVVHYFTGGDGAYPSGGLIQTPNGKLYGVTHNGGIIDPELQGNGGFIYSFNPADSAFKDEHVLSRVPKPNDGLGLIGPLVLASGGKLYGVTANGGLEHGVIFSFDINTAAYTTLFRFDNENGETPQANPIWASDGKLYGTTYEGGTASIGIAYSYDPTADTPFHKLIDFTSANGAYPRSSFVEVTTCDTCSPVKVNIANASVREGNNGTTDLDFVVALSGSSAQTVTVKYHTVDNTAIAPDDYAARTGTLTFTPGLRKRRITIKIKGDNISELKENFRVVLTNPVNATIGDASATGVILNDDGELSNSQPVIAKGVNGQQQGTATATNQCTLTATPNPASSVIKIHLSGFAGAATLQLITVQGRMIKTVKLQQTKTGEYRLSVAAIASGTYFLTATDGQGNKQTVSVVVAR